MEEILIVIIVMLVIAIAFVITSHIYRQATCEHNWSQWVKTYTNRTDYDKDRFCHSCGKSEHDFHFSLFPH